MGTAWRTALALSLGGVALSASLAQPARAQVRPVARPPDLVIPAPEDRIVPASSAPAVSPDDALAALPSGAEAAPEEEAPPAGLVTGLPLPRFVSLKRGEGNARRGPSLDQRIDWVFVRPGMPLLLTAEYDNWRRVEDRDGEGGWVHYTLLSGTRTVIVDQDLLPLRAREDDRSPEVARLQAGVIAAVETCGLDWCRVAAGGFSGWAPKAALWGVGADEVLD